MGIYTMTLHICTPTHMHISVMYTFALKPTLYDIKYGVVNNSTVRVSVDTTVDTE